MSSFRYDYAVIGGDLRQAYLIPELLSETPYVCHYALCQPPLKIASATSSLENVLSRSASIICPIPLSKDGSFLNQSWVKEPIPLSHLTSPLKKGQRFFAGCLTDSVLKELRQKGVLPYDFMKDGGLSHFNTIATAEGVICEAIQASPQNLHHSKCAVLGYGKCGFAIASALKGLSCTVTVASISEEERAKASVAVNEALDFPEFYQKIGSFDFIFNTAPALVLPKEQLQQVSSHAVILDIASAPGGVDFKAAKELSKTALLCPALPGRYAPLSSAKAIVKSIKKAEYFFERS